MTYTQIFTIPLRELQIFNFLLSRIRLSIMIRQESVCQRSVSGDGDDPPPPPATDTQSHGKFPDFSPILYGRN